MNNTNELDEKESRSNSELKMTCPICMNEYNCEVKIVTLHCGITSVIGA